jgi:UDP-N-acetyl-D-glucosamine dehydrogenase
MSTRVIDRIQSRSAVVGIIGQGYVGLPLALLFEQAGFTVRGFDVDARKVDALNRGTSYIKHIGSERVASAIAHGRFRATTNFNELGSCDAILICVPTPLGKHREPDLSFIKDTSREIAVRLRKGQLIVLESTTYPGTTDDEVRPILEKKSGLRCPQDFLLAFSPEREDPGNPTFHTKSIPKVVGGVNCESTEVAVALYAAAVDRVVTVSSAKVAESCKLLENVYRSINIALVNELKMTFDRMGINIWEVIEAAKTKPFGFTPFYPGPGLGGHCIPLDPFYLSWKASEFGMWTRFIELAGEINTQMPRYVFLKIGEALNEIGRSVRGARICVLGLSYKENIDDDRESPSYEIIELLQEAGAHVDYCDPFFPKARAGRKHDIGLVSVPCTADALGQFDALVVATAHEQFKDAALYRGAPLVIDTRNIVRPHPDGPARVIRA